MSYVFTNLESEETIWSPALQTGSLFVAVCTLVSKSIDKPLGFTDMASDYIQVDASLFAAFVDDWLNKYLSTENTLLQMEWKPYLVLSIAMLKRLGHKVSSDSKTGQALIDEADTLLPHMPV